MGTMNSYGKRTVKKAAQPRRGAMQLEPQCSDRISNRPRVVFAGASYR
jgi:hypothetical protein